PRNRFHDCRLRGRRARGNALRRGRITEPAPGRLSPVAARPDAQAAQLHGEAPAGPESTKREPGAPPAASGPPVAGTGAAPRSRRITHASRVAGKPETYPPASRARARRLAAAYAGCCTGAAAAADGLAATTPA